MKRLILTIALALSAPSFASDRQCPTEQERERLIEFRDRVAAAESPEAARELALSQTRVAHQALDRAGKLFGEKALRDEAARLENFEEEVRAAPDQAAVVAEFDALMGPRLLNACHYDGVEIVIIVIGFILGIIPGILFLFLFC